MSTGPSGKTIPIVDWQTWLCVHVLVGCRSICNLTQSRINSPRLSLPSAQCVTHSGRDRHRLFEHVVQLIIITVTWFYSCKQGTSDETTLVLYQIHYSNPDALGHPLLVKHIDGNYVVDVLDSALNWTGCIMTLMSAGTQKTYMYLQSPSTHRRWRHGDGSICKWSRFYE